MYNLCISNIKFNNLGAAYQCDMVKRNESDVGNIDFELKAERGDIF